MESAFVQVCFKGGFEGRERRRGSDMRRQRVPERRSRRGKCSATKGRRCLGACKLESIRRAKISNRNMDRNEVLQINGGDVIEALVCEEKYFKLNALLNR